MRGLIYVGLLATFTVACSNDVDPRIIPGGGIGDGEIDGEVNVGVIDGQTEAPIAGATVTVGEKTKTTDAKGFATFSDVEGPQTISVVATGYRSSAQIGANGANVTVGLQANATTIDQATLSGSLAGWSSITVPHIKAAFITFSQTNDLGNKANDLKTPADANRCIAGNECNWSVVTRTGAVTLIAIIVDYDPHGTADPSDDTASVVGYATKTGITVNAGINQSGLVLDQVEAGNLQNVTLDAGTPPAGLPEVVTMAGIEISSDEVAQFPLFVFTKDSAVLIPKPSLFGGEATYRLTAIAGTTSGDAGAQSVVLRQGLAATSTTLAAGTWLTTPVNVDITRTTASWGTVTGAAAYSVKYSDTSGELLEVSVLDPKATSLEVPSAVALPSTGTLTARMQAIGADFDLNDFSLKEDSDQLWGVAVQPTTIP